MLLEGDALVASRDALRSAVEFGTLLAWFFVADRTSIIAAGPKVRPEGGRHGGPGPRGMHCCCL